jgi:asparagine synthase (glutamine-hydrolysing)
MCGIYGWIPKSAQPGREWAKVVERVSASMRHRGPDDTGCCIVDTRQTVIPDPPSSIEHFRLLLGHTRLAIIDLSPGGHQPMVSPDGNYAITFGGEIYNYKELRTELSKLGVVFQSSSDTEVLLWSYIKWGRACLDHLNGMFAFAVYDGVNQTLFCARDCFGIKPFFYTDGPSGFLFASELRALLEFPGVDRRLNWQKAYDYLQFCAVSVGGETLVRNVKEIPPAHYVEVKLDGGPVGGPVRYWTPPLGETRAVSYRDATHQLQEMLLESVRLHLRSDVPLGVAVSGGIDSSIIACAVRKLQPDLPLNTFSFDAVASEVSEARWIRLVNDATRANGHDVRISPDDIIDDLEHWILAQGEPVNNTSMYAQYRVFKLAREQGITVTLDGQGADELFAGYDGYPHARLRSMLGRGQIVRATRLLAAQRNWPGRSSWRTAQNVLKSLVPSDWFWVGALAVGRPMHPSWLRMENFRANNVEFRFYHDAVYQSKDKLREALAYDATWQRLPLLLRYGDRNSMSWSIESRVPFCSRPVAEFVFSLPEDYLLGPDGMSKRLLRDSMRGIVPDTILDRKDKIGFATPELRWLDSIKPWIASVLGSSANSAVIDCKGIMDRWEETVGGRRANDYTIWRCVNFLRWLSIMRISE